ncbi:HAMP domain-containing sensor histidine kinase [Azospirillum sp. SYSU D00513]|uniref:ATP-binding protein n=1 Tax=Azospirillum sp. SYSU D00513 TaxID=2812561 RepID=UPI001A95B055
MAGRAALGFGIAFALVLVLALAGLFSLSAIDREVGAFSAVADASHAAADVDIALRDLEVAVRDYMDAGDQGSLEETAERRATLEQRLAGLAALVTAPADQASAEAAGAALKEYWAAFERIVALRSERTRLTGAVVEPLVASIRDRLAKLKDAGGVDSAALAGDATISVLLMRDHLIRYVEARDPADSERMRVELDAARNRLAEMNRYLWVPGTRQLIDEVAAMLNEAVGVLDRVEELVVEEEVQRGDALSTGADAVSAKAAEIRRRTQALAGSLRRGLDAGTAGYGTLALWVGGLVLLTGLLAVWLLHRSVARPVKAMTRAITLLSQGRTAVDLPAVAGTDEIAGLAHALAGLRDSNQETDRLRQEAQELHDRLRAEKKRLEVSDQAKSDFLVNMGQELHAPLNRIIHSSQTLMSELHRMGAGELANDAEMIQWTGEQLVTMVDSMLDYARIEAGGMDVCLQDFDVNRLLVEVRERALPQADLHGNSLSVKAPAGLGLMNTDFTKVRQALLNLLDNACKYTREGEVTLSAERVERDGLAQMRFTVADTGPGFPPGQTRQLFQPFVRGAAADGDGGNGGRSRGAGLGLTLVGHFTAMLGGLVEVSSDTGAGTRVTLTIPVRYDSAEVDRLLRSGEETTSTKDSARRVLTVTPPRPVAQIAG